MPNKRKYNILLIHADQHRFDCMGVAGNKEIQTPNLDQLAKDGVYYKNSFCPYPVCTPSRYSLLSGLYVHQHMGWTNSSTLSPGIETFPKILREAGYKTVGIGKMHFTPMYLDVGFDHLELTEGRIDPPRMEREYYQYLKANGYEKRASKLRNIFGAADYLLPEESHDTAWTGRKALEVIDQWDEEGNFLMVGFMRPHPPYEPPTPWNTYYDPQDITPLPGWTETLPLADKVNWQEKKVRRNENSDMSGLTQEDIKLTTAYYYGCISHVDEYIGRIISKLKEKGLYDDTIIIYTSDHGDYMGFHNMVSKGRYMYDSLVRVPLIIKYPGQKGGGAVHDGLYNNVDLAPTILKQIGSKPGKYMDGLDMATDKGGREYIFTEKERGTYMVRTKNRKLLLCQTRQSLFFDLEKDPFELNNVIDDAAYQADIQSCKDALFKWFLYDAVTPANVDLQAPVIK